MREVVLTDKLGNKTGTADIIDAHTGEGKLHSAFSVYIFRNNRAEILLQQRATEKMLFQLLWANTCCSHPHIGEDVIDAGERRLKEECGFSIPLRKEGAIVYKAEDPKGNGIEYEYDALLTGDVIDEISLDPDPNEIAALEWRKTDEVLEDMKAHPHSYAPWFHKGLRKLLGIDDE